MEFDYSSSKDPYTSSQDCINIRSQSAHRLTEKHVRKLSRVDTGKNTPAVKHIQWLLQKSTMFENTGNWHDFGVPKHFR